MRLTRSTPGADSAISISRLERGAAKSKQSAPRAVIHRSESVTSTSFDAAREKPKSRLPWKTIRNTAKAIPTTVARNRTRSCKIFFQASRILRTYTTAHQCTSAAFHANFSVNEIVYQRREDSPIIFEGDEEMCCSGESAWKARFHAL